MKYGSILDLLAGQFEPEPRSLDRHASTIGGQGRNPVAAEAHVDLAAPVATVSERYLSFSIDTSQVVGGKWWNPAATGVEFGSGTVTASAFDFGRPRLDHLARALAPAYLRIGGSEADKVFYDLQAEGESHRAIPPGYKSVLTRRHGAPYPGRAFVGDWTAGCASAPAFVHSCTMREGMRLMQNQATVAPTALRRAGTGY